jgi:hypothetical protein
MFFFLAIGLAGYFSTYEKTGQIVIERDPLDGEKYDYLMIVGQILIIMVLCIAYPINVIPIKSIAI